MLQRVDERFFRRVFTLEEANRTLPLVKRIVADILRVGRLVKAFDEEYGEMARVMPVVKPYIEELRSYAEELEAIGCFFQDWNFEMGLVDFPAKFEGRIVFLCWRSDEPTIQYYHEVDAGYAGRKPIPKRFSDS